jgi:ADP-ribose pyrophosphatase YjhB (NUDIX family)
MKQTSFCPRCGSPLSDKFREGRTRRFCDRCRQPVYENAIPATCIIVSSPPDHVLLVKRNIEPKFGHWCLPGGFMELGETPEQCALRELEEETGLTGRIEMLLGAASTPNRQYGNVLMLGFLVTRISGSIRPGGDVSEATYFRYEALPEIAFNSHRRFIRIYFAAYKA